MSEITQRYYGQKAVRQTGSHPDPMEQEPEVEVGDTVEAIVKGDYCNEMEIRGRVTHIFKNGRGHIETDEGQTFRFEVSKSFVISKGE